MFYRSGSQSEPATWPRPIHWPVMERVWRSTVVGAKARPEALVWALERGSRSGRVAQQFARDYAGRNGGG